MGSSRKTHPIYPNICENFAVNIVDFEERALLTFPDYPLTYRSLITIVIHADFKQALAISRIRNQISLVIYLPDCILGSKPSYTTILPPGIQNALAELSCTRLNSQL